MTLKKSNSIAIACVFLWIGFVCAISFLEAWLKFQAPGVTISIGLGIGQLVFGALNKVEWFLALVIFAIVLSNRQNFKPRDHIYFFVAFGILLIQTMWLLPALDARAVLYINNQPAPPSSLHIYFVAAEVIKVYCLVITGLSFFKKMSND